MFVLHSCCPCIVLMFVVQFEFKFFEFEFKLNLFEGFCKRKEKKRKPETPLFSPTSSPARFFFFHPAQTSLPSPAQTLFPLSPSFPLPAAQSCRPNLTSSRPISHQARSTPRPSPAVTAERAPPVGPSSLLQPSWTRFRGGVRPRPDVRDVARTPRGPCAL